VDDRAAAVEAGDDVLDVRLGDGEVAQLGAQHAADVHQPEGDQADQDPPAEAHHAAPTQVYVDSAARSYPATEPPAPSAAAKKIDTRMTPKTVLAADRWHRGVLDVMGSSAIGGARWKRPVENPPVHRATARGLRGPPPTATLPQ
jgi:hypothetical protein